MPDAIFPSLPWAPAALHSIALVPVLVILAFVAWNWWRLAARNRDIEADRELLCNALERLGDGDFSNAGIGFGSAVFDPIDAVYRRVVPAVRTTIEELQWHGQHDALTGACNAQEFRKRSLEYLSGGCEAESRGGAMLFFDINDFKKINDNLGHEAGDRFLAVCADRIRLACTNFKSAKLAAMLANAGTDELEPIIGRLGGDEFGIFLPGNPDISDVEKFVVWLQRLINEPCQIGSHSLNAAISVGIALSGDHRHNFKQLLAAADTAMYEAKSAGSGYRFFDGAMRNKADQILQREMEIRTAIQRSDFVLFYQPQVNLANNRIESVEALIRWNHPEHGIVGPDEFIPFAETHNLIDDLGDWVVQEAIATAARWRRMGHDIRISVNISPKQLNWVELIPLIRALLNHHGVPPKALEIEITEAALMRSDEITRERLKGLRRDGVAIALDDFGTGYSNLARLLTLPLDRIKIDRSLLEASISERHTRLVLHAVIQLARRLGVGVVAEGVEQEAQLRFLKLAKCDVAQGFLLSRPVPEEQLLELCRQHKCGWYAASAA